MEKRYKIFSTLLIATIVLIIVVKSNTEDYNETNSITVENQQQKTFYNLENQAELLKTTLTKTLVANSSEQKIVLLIDAYQNISSIQSSLSQLQMNQESLTMTKRFFSQLREYCYSAILSEIYMDINEKTEQENLKKLQMYEEYATIFAEQVKQSQSLYRDDQIVMGLSLNNKIKDIYKPTSDEAEYYFYNFENKISQYYQSNPTDSYFANAMKREPKGLTGKDVGAFEAKEKAKKYITQNVKKIELVEVGKDSGQSGMPVYIFSANTNDSKVIIAISKQGGNFVYMQNTRAVSDANITIDESQKKAEEYMKYLGYENIKLINYQVYSGNVTFHYANVTNGIIVYPEKLSIRVALDNGEILGVDISEYYNNHQERQLDFTTPKITLTQARLSISKEIKIIEQNTVIMQRKNNEEALSYEFIGEFRGEKYAIYVNAKTGKQEAIYKLITNDNGTSWV